MATEPLHVLITGASEGIGLATALRFSALADRDVCLSICSRSMAKLVPARERIAAYTSSAVFAESCDVSDPTAVQHFADRALRAQGPIDILVNNAGIGAFHAVTEMPTHVFDQVLATNLRGTFLMTKAVLPLMMKRQRGTIITISSVAGKTAYPRGTAYNTSKFGVRGIMQSLFLEVRDHNIRVITVSPGNVETAFFTAAGVPLSVSDVLQAEDVAEAVVAAAMLPSRATISEIDVVPTNPKRFVT